MHPAVLHVDLELTDPDARRRERHHFVNLVHVVHAELQLVERMIDSADMFQTEIRLCEAAIRAFSDRNTAEGYRDELIDFRSRIAASVRPVTHPAKGSAEVDADVRDAGAILLDALEAADVRVQELLARHGVERPTEELNAADLPAHHSDGSAVGCKGDSEPASRIDAPKGFCAALAGLLDHLGSDTVVSASAGKSALISVRVPGGTIPGKELATGGPVDYESIRDDPDASAKRALLKLLFTVQGRGVARIESHDSPDDTLTIVLPDQRV